MVALEERHSERTVTLPELGIETPFGVSKSSKHLHIEG